MSLERFTIARQLTEYLYRSQHDPGLRFEG